MAPRAGARDFRIVAILGARPLAVRVCVPTDIGIQRVVVVDGIAVIGMLDGMPLLGGLGLHGGG
jgi:hypothetical protein